MSSEQPSERRYRNAEIEILWQPALCTHCENCIRKEANDDGPRGLPEVFNLTPPPHSPWINMHGATTEAIVKQVEACPSGALTVTKK